MKKLVVLALGIILTGCVTSKGYEGPTLEDDELARIYMSKVTRTSHGKQTILIAESNGKEVGSGSKGYPSYVSVLPGEVEIGYKIHTRNIGKSIAIGLTAGLMLGPGAVGAMDVGGREKNKYTHVFFVEKGKTYIIMLDYNENEPNIPVLKLNEYVPPETRSRKKAGRRS